MIQKKDSAVSPVIGVLLMLVVTIIIAAIVSAFAGGMTSDQSKAPQTAIAATSGIVNISDTDKTNWGPDYPADFTADNGIVFESKGGDAFNVNDIAIQLQSADTKVVISNSDTLATSTCLETSVTSYIMKVGATSTADKSINIGDKFKLFADNCYDASESASPMNPMLTWEPVGAESGFGAETGQKLDYKIIDKASQKVISQGQLIL